MFERITIARQSVSGNPLDLGFLAECLVFYEKVRVIADPESFRYLVRSCGPDELLDLLRAGLLEIEFFDNLTGVPTVQTNMGPVHDLGCFSTEQGKFPQVSRKLFDELAGASGKGANKRFTQFSRLVQRSVYTPEMLQQAREDWLDSSYIVPAVKSLLLRAAPEYKVPDPFIFQLQKVPGGFKVTTNIDFEAANASYHQHVPKEFSTLSEAYILISLADTRRDLLVGSRLSSEFALAPDRALIAACKFAELLSTASRGVSVTNLFQEEVVEGVPNIREAVNSGGRTFRDVIQLVEKGEKFKNWLGKHETEQSLRAAYCREVAHVDWADKLPPKSARWLLITAATTALSLAGGPIAGTAAATALSAADYFLLDRLVKGWKPNQFIEGPLKKFLRFGSK